MRFLPYGASRFALALGDRKTAEEIWPLVEWCIEYSKRKMTPDGVIASDSDELEGRFPAGWNEMKLMNIFAFGDRKIDLMITRSGKKVIVNIVADGREIKNIQVENGNKVDVILKHN